jgi:hypothetical protein
VNNKKTATIEKQLNEDLDSILSKIIQSEDFKLKEGSSGTPISPYSAISSADRGKLVRLFNQLKDIVYAPDWNIDFQQDRIVITKKDPARISYDYTPYMASLVEFMIKEGLNVTPLPSIKIRKDINETVDFFGKTAYYDPTTKEVVLYTLGRHPKDVMRSFAHEMIHHRQNLEGRIGQINTSNTNESSDLQVLEEEAYREGNMAFRKWEDWYKNNKK